MNITLISKKCEQHKEKAVKGFNSGDKKRPLRSSKNKIKPHNITFHIRNTYPTLSCDT